jgi:hypothetical protein
VLSRTILLVTKFKGKEIEWAYGIYLDMRYTHGVFMGKPEGKR